MAVFLPSVDYLTRLRYNKFILLWKGQFFMNISEVNERTPLLIEQLLTVWESSVRATHLFLSDAEINQIKELTVNEQNPQAVGFYEHMGFKTYKRTDFDEEGNPYPLLYLQLI